MQVSAIINMSEDNVLDNNNVIHLIDESQLSAEEIFERDLAMAIKNSHESFNDEWEKPVVEVPIIEDCNTLFKKVVPIKDDHPEFVVVEHKSSYNPFGPDEAFVCLSERDIKLPHKILPSTEKDSINDVKEVKDVIVIDTTEDSEVQNAIDEDEVSDDRVDEYNFDMLMNEEEFPSDSNSESNGSNSESDDSNSELEDYTIYHDLTRINEHVPVSDKNRRRFERDDRPIQYQAHDALVNVIPKHLSNSHGRIFELRNDFKGFLLFQSPISNKKNDDLKLRIKDIFEEENNVTILDVIYNMKLRKDPDDNDSEKTAFRIAYSPDYFKCQELHKTKEIKRGGHMAIHMAGDALNVSVKLALLGINLKYQNRVLVGDARRIYITCLGTFDIHTVETMYEMANDDWESMFGPVMFMEAIKEAFTNEEDKFLVGVHMKKIFKMANEYKPTGKKCARRLTPVILALGRLAECCNVISILGDLTTKIKEINNKMNNKKEKLGKKKTSTDSDRNAQNIKKRSLAQTDSAPKSDSDVNKGQLSDVISEPDRVKKAKHATKKSSTIRKDPFAEPEPSDSEAVSQTNESDSEGDYSEHDSDRDFIVDDEGMSEEVAKEARAAGTSYPRDLQSVGEKGEVGEDSIY